MQTEIKKATDSPHNAGLICELRTRVCKACGWSPEVDARRRATLRDKEEAKL